MGDDLLLKFLPTGVRGIPNFARYSSLLSNWKFSNEVLTGTRQKLKGKLSANVECIALAGSLGRLEGCSSSDADYIMIVTEAQDKSVGQDKKVLHDVLSSLSVSPPNKSGVFSSPRAPSELIESVGNAEEESDVLGKRMLLLLESRPIFGDVKFLELIRRIFDRYTSEVNHDSSKDHAFLLNDLIRYFRYICVNYQSSFWRENEKWPLRNIKLRHSRILMYTGLLFLIGEASKYDDAKKVGVVWDNLGLTPLERIAWVYHQNGDRNFFRIAGLYNVFVSRLNDVEIRNALSAFDYEDRYNVPVFAELKANSDAFVAELLRFVSSRRGTWSERFFEYLIF